MEMPSHFVGEKEQTEKEGARDVDGTPYAERNRALLFSMSFPTFKKRCSQAGGVSTSCRWCIFMTFSIHGVISVYSVLDTCGTATEDHEGPRVSDNALLTPSL